MLPVRLLAGTVPVPGEALRLVIKVAAFCELLVLHLPEPCFLFEAKRFRRILAVVDRFDVGECAFVSPFVIRVEARASLQLHRRLPFRAAAVIDLRWCWRWCQRWLRRR